MAKKHSLSNNKHISFIAREEFRHISCVCPLGMYDQISLERSCSVLEYNQAPVFCLHVNKRHSDLLLLPQHEIHSELLWKWKDIKSAKKRRQATDEQIYRRRADTRNGNSLGRGTAGLGGGWKPPDMMTRTLTLVQEQGRMCISREVTALFANNLRPVCKLTQAYYFRD